MAAVGEPTRCARALPIAKGDELQVQDEAGRRYTASVLGLLRGRNPFVALVMIEPADSAEGTAPDES